MGGSVGGVVIWKQGWGLGGAQPQFEGSKHPKNGAVNPTHYNLNGVSVFGVWVVVTLNPVVAMLIGSFPVAVSVLNGA